jgi:2-dehydropantoate 2-reductase
LKEICTIYLSGLGAIGTPFAYQLQQADPGCLRVVADSERIERYTTQGVFVNGTPVTFRYLQPGQSAPPADLILIAVKEYQLAGALAGLRGFVGDQTIILALENGITSEKIVAREFGMEKLLYSFVVGGSVREGTNVRFAKTGTIFFGERNNDTYSDKVIAVKQFFDRTGIPYRIPQDMIRELWWKFMLNVGLNQLSALLRAPYGVFQSVPEARELLRKVCREVVRVSEQAGTGLRESDIEDCFRNIEAIPPEAKTSMLQDVEAGRKTEVDIFAGTVTELGRRYGVPTPLNDMLYQMIRTVEQMYAGK